MTDATVENHLCPLSLIAEVTHRCPLHCVYCSNPLELQRTQNELTTEQWKRTLQQAAALGVLHLHLTGGEPLARPDLVELVRTGREAGLYVNLVTSGIGMNEARLRMLVDAGVEHLQISFQDSDAQMADELAGTRAHAHKLALAAMVRKFPVAFTVNIVVHRGNLDRLPEMLAMAEQLSPDRLEIAHVQYYGWALRNRALLMPTAEQVANSLEVVAAAKERLQGRVQVQAVMPDYFARYPKPCVGGWGRQMMLVDPAGRVLPCHAAGVIPGLEFESVRERPLEWIWRNSAAFNAFRGDDWMAEPCRSCERKTKDFGGCRCQAFLLTGNAANTDPACSLSPHHGTLQEIMREPAQEKWEYRVQAKGGGSV